MDRDRPSQCGTGAVAILSTRAVPVDAVGDSNGEARPGWRKCEDPRCWFLQPPKLLRPDHAYLVCGGCTELEDVGIEHAPKVALFSVSHDCFWSCSLRDGR